MEIIFKDERLQKLFLDKRKLTRKYGPDIAKQVVQRVAEIFACEHLAMLKEIPCGLHPLKYDRKGQFAVDLGSAFRLIFEPANQTLPRRQDNSLIWEKIESVRILEIVDYHNG